MSPTPSRFARAFGAGTQLVAWGAFLLLPGMFKPGADTYGAVFSDLFTPVRLLTGFFCIGAFYLTYRYLVPRLLVPRRYVRLGLAVVGIVVAFGLMEFSVSYAPGYGGGVRLQPVGAPDWNPPPPGQAQVLFDPKTRRPPAMSLSDRLFSGFGPGSTLYQLLISLGAGFALSLGREYRREREQRLDTEVAFLRAQINPHFLFNTLNTLYALALAKSDSAPEAVLRLAAIMRYAVAQAGQVLVPLKEELAYLDGYVELQRLRLPPATKLVYQAPQSTGSARIAPLLLVIPIENCFTHGVGQEEDNEIRILLAYEGTDLRLDIENSVPANRQEYASPSTGTGMKRLREYLASRYAGRHTLTYGTYRDRFHLTLTMTLDG